MDAPSRSHPSAGTSYVEVGDVEWEEQTPQSRRKIVRSRTTSTSRSSSGTRGFTLPVLDEHGGSEATVYMLEGTFTDHYRSSGAGTVIRGAPGSSHQPGTPDGVTFIVTRTLLPGERERIAPSSTPTL